MHGRYVMEGIAGAQVLVRVAGTTTAAKLYDGPFSVVQLPNPVTLPTVVAGGQTKFVIWTEGRLDFVNASTGVVIPGGLDVQVDANPIIDLSGAYFGCKDGEEISAKWNTALVASEAGWGTVYVPFKSILIADTINVGSRAKCSGLGRYSSFVTRSATMYGPSVAFRPTYGTSKAAQTSPQSEFNGFFFSNAYNGIIRAQGRITKDELFITNLDPSIVAQVKVGYIPQGYGFDVDCFIDLIVDATTLRMSKVAKNTNYSIGGIGQDLTLIWFRECYRVSAVFTAGSKEITLAVPVPETKVGMRTNSLPLADGGGDDDEPNGELSQHTSIKYRISDTVLQLDKFATASGSALVAIRREDDIFYIPEASQFEGNVGDKILKGPKVWEVAGDAANGSGWRGRGGRNLGNISDFKFTNCFINFDTTGASDSKCSNGGLGGAMAWNAHFSAQATVDFGFMEIYRTKWTDQYADAHFQGCPAVSVHGIRGWNGHARFVSNPNRKGSAYLVADVAFVYQDGSAGADGKRRDWIAIDNGAFVDVYGCSFQGDLTAGGKNYAPDYIVFAENANCGAQIMNTSMYFDKLDTDLNSAGVPFDYRPFRVNVGNRDTIGYQITDKRTLEYRIGGKRRISGVVVNDGLVGSTTNADFLMVDGGTTTVPQNVTEVTLRKGTPSVAGQNIRFPPNPFDGQPVRFMIYPAVTGLVMLANNNSVPQRLYSKQVLPANTPVNCTLDFRWRDTPSDAADFPASPGAWQLVGVGALPV